MDKNSNIINGILKIIFGWCKAMQREEKVTKSELLVVTGLSGAGKSVVIQSLEDIGYFV